MENDIWKDIKGFEEIYKVSSVGKVYSKRNKIILKPCVGHKGHLSYSLSKNGKVLRIGAHVLVALNFIGEPPTDRHIVLHLDDSPLNNAYTNLKWGTYSENAVMAVSHGNLVPPPPSTRCRGKANWISKCVEQYDLDFQFISEYESASIAGKQNNFNYKNILRCCNGHRPTSHGYIWKFKTTKTSHYLQTTIISNE